MPILTCEYCPGTRAETVTGAIVYPHRSDLRDRLFYRCPKCGAYVGAHGATGEPLGSMADDTLRAARRRAHREFDSLWQSGRMSRSDAYAWLSSELDIPPAECHIGMFGLRECQAVVDAVCRLEFSEF